MTGENRHRNLLLAVLIFSLGGAVIWFIPTEFGERRDFISLYGQSVAVLRGLPLYDEKAQEKSVSLLLGVPPGTVPIPASPYPPWYGILTFFLGIFPLRTAAQVWCLCNVAMLFSGMLLLSRNWSIRKRFILLLGCVSFPPFIGLLLVGQTIMPLVLGIALCCYGIRREKALANAFGLFLLTLKPHLGILPYSAGVILAFKNAEFFRKTIVWFMGIFGAAVIVSFVVERNWVTEIMQAFSRWNAYSVNIQRDTCSSLVIELSRYLSLNDHVLWPGLAAMVLAVTALLWIWLAYGKNNINPMHYMSVSILLTLLVAPYVRNYDYVLLLVPVAVAMGSPRSNAAQVTILISYAFGYAMVLLVSREMQGRLFWVSAILPVIPFVRKVIKEE